MNGDPRAAKAFLGIGWAFPVQLRADGRLSVVEHDEDVRQAIRIILSTNPGERVMRPAFGAGLNEFVFEPVSTATLALIKTRVEQSLIDWEPRIDLQEVGVRADGDDRNRVLIEVTYRVRATNTVHNLVYPFYLQEGAAA
jgi:Bacteriophage baseplate protein W